MSSIVQSVIGWLRRQSNLTHAGLTVTASLASIPALTHLSGTGLAATNLISLSTQLGSQIYVAFVGGPAMFANLEKTAFGNLQAVLFPKFGLLCMSTGIVGLTTYHLSHTQSDICTWLLVGSLAVHILNSFLIFPKTTEYMFLLRQSEKTENRELISKNRMRFGVMHGISNLINIGSLGANMLYLYVLATRIAAIW